VLSKLWDERQKLDEPPQKKKKKGQLLTFRIHEAFVTGRLDGDTSQRGPMFQKDSITGISPPIFLAPKQ
jgi:hypothetical protein